MSFIATWQESGFESLIQIDEVTFQYEGRQIEEDGQVKLVSALSVWMDSFQLLAEISCDLKSKMSPLELFSLHVFHAVRTYNQYFGLLRRKYLLKVISENELECLKFLYPGNLKELKP